MNRILFTFALCAFSLLSTAQSPTAYRLFDSQGKPVAYPQMIAQLTDADVVFFGEMHNDPICHWMEVQVLKSLFQTKKGKINVGMEMFEADNQLIIDEYFSNVIDYKQFEDECRLWPNYSTDYAAIVDFCKENNIHFTATNVPRRYASVVKSRGLANLDSLSDEAKRYFPHLPIPYEDNAVANEAFGMMAQMGANKDANPTFLGQAQGLKDATMAWFIAQNLDKAVIHFNGNYHTAAGNGIIKYLHTYAPKAKVKTIYSVKQETTDTLDDAYAGQADFYLCVPEDMVTSY